MDIVVVTAADHDGWITYYVLEPDEQNENIHSVQDIEDLEDGPIRKFKGIASYTEWVQENDVEVVSYWETRMP